MKDGELDRVDEQILVALQRDGRATITEIAERLPVSGNTVRNRVRAMEEAGVIRGYTIDVDYIRAGLPFHYQFTCTAPISERSRLAEGAFDVRGVLNVRELMIGQRNVVIEAVGENQDDITRIAQALDELGLMVVDENLVRTDETRPLSLWSEDGPEDDGGYEYGAAEDEGGGGEDDD